MQVQDTWRSTLCSTTIEAVTPRRGGSKPDMIKIPKWLDVATEESRKYTKDRIMKTTKTILTMHIYPWGVSDLMHRHVGLAAFGVGVNVLGKIPIAYQLYNNATKVPCI